MSELIQKHDNRATIRWKLLTGVSAATLIASACCAGGALAEDDSGNAQVWIELGAQLEQANGGDNPFVAPFYSHLDPSFTSPTKIQKELPWALGPEAKISFQPEDSDWIFSAGVRYGRANNRRRTHGQGKADEQFPQITLTPVKVYYTTPGYTSYYYFIRKCCHNTGGVHTPTKVEFSDIQSRRQERHLILDFEAGKDVGLGLFGKQGSSVIDAGVRIAQFNTSSEISIKARADLQHYNHYSLPAHATLLAQYPQLYAVRSNFRNYSLTAGSSRSTKLIGPSLSWNASAAIAGNTESAQLMLDWGVNVAMLFGKQKAKVHHQSSAQQRYGDYNPQRPNPGYGYHNLYYHPRVDIARSRNVTVPNVGGMAGFSIKWPNAKISFGYRADYFFGAMDDGWDTAKKGNRSFMGPFASISVGIGD